MKKFRGWGFGVVGVDAVLGGGFALWGGADAVLGGGFSAVGADAVLGGGFALWGRTQFWVEDLALWGRTQFWAGASPCKRDNIPVN